MDEISSPDENIAYNVELPEFEGPLDLLLALIEREELDITRVSLAYVTDQYLAYLEVLQQVNPDEVADFLVIAARLILIKSEALLPRPPASLIFSNEEDVGDELARQLLAYKLFKEAAGWLREIEARGQRNFVRTAPPLKIEPRLAPGEISLDQLIRAARRALAVKPPDPDVNTVVAPEKITIGQQMAHIRRELTAGRAVSFSRLLTTDSSRLEVIVTLLAVLELIKRRVIAVEQTGLFGEIVIRPSQDTLSLSDTEWAELTGLIDVS